MVINNWETSIYKILDDIEHAALDELDDKKINDYFIMKGVKRFIV